ncbi:MAG TPA: HAMP domain-containing protein [Crenotrichaceae bacterium]|nr:HAMP domain-containing protein [Crenotrichaceae bacterium]
MMSKALFLRSYLIIVFLILAVGWGLDRILVYYNEQENSSSEKTQLLGSFLYIDTLIKHSGSNVEAAWEQLHRVFEKTLGFPVALYQLSDFSADKSFLNGLASGQVIALSNEQDALVYYRKISDSDHIVALGPVEDRGNRPSSDIMLIAAYHLFVAVVLFFWLRPLSNDLHELRTAAMHFGDDNFSTRVNINHSSSIRPVADAFNSMARRIEDLVSAHEDLTHAVSHELKTPLSRFKFSLEIMTNLDDSKQRQAYLQAMKDDVRELDGLIDEMLSYAQFGVHNLKLNLEVVHAEDWLKEIISQYNPDINGVDINLVVDTSGEAETIRIDKHLMSRAIHNLIRNGLCYAQSQLLVTLQLVDGRVILLIEDDGLGIPEQFREQVFQPFSRLDSSRNRQSGGHGLGLAIAQKVIMQHGGSISVGESSLGGAGFKLNWPG